MSVCSQEWTDQILIFQMLLEELFPPKLVLLVLFWITLVVLGCLKYRLSTCHEWLKFKLSLSYHCSLTFVGNIQGLHGIHGNFNFSNMPGTFASRNSTMLAGPPAGVQQVSGSGSSGRFNINNLPAALSQVFKFYIFRFLATIQCSPFLTHADACTYMQCGLFEANYSLIWDISWMQLSLASSHGHSGVANNGGTNSRKHKYHWCAFSLSCVHLLP